MRKAAGGALVPARGPAHEGVETVLVLQKVGGRAVKGNASAIKDDRAWGGKSSYMIIAGIVPGPNIMSERPELFWGVVASMWVGNLMLLALNVPLIGLWVRLLSVPYRALFPAIIGICCVGA